MVLCYVLKQMNITHTFKEVYVRLGPPKFSVQYGP